MAIAHPMLDVLKLSYLASRTSKNHDSQCLEKEERTMSKNYNAPWVRAGIVAFAVLGILLLAGSAEAKSKLKLKSAPKTPTPSSVSTPHVPETPKPQTKAETGPRIPQVNVSVTSQSRGLFQRIWDWVFGRKPAPASAPGSVPTPAVAPVASSPTLATVPPSAVVVAPAAPAKPPVIVPVAVPAATPASPAAPAAVTSREEKPKKLEELEFPTIQPKKPEPIVKGYILHLKNGRRISTFYYEDKGDQVVIPQHGGTYGLPKSLISRIEVVKENP
jgi:hypothetical protein